ncbi:MAG: PAS domain S-box protein [Gammaproteobacteria bacterium]|nr:PAS domain S-box protein [Gammaproteobacteria bacterium]
MGDGVDIGGTGAGSTGSGRGSTIVIAAATAAEVELLRRAVAGVGYTVFTARDGAEALAMARAEHPDAVVSAIDTPVMDGYSLCHAIRRDAALKDTPVMLLATPAHPIDVIRGLGAGADGYLIKPYEVPALLSGIESLLAHPSAPPPVERRKVRIQWAGETHVVDAHGPRLLNQLIATYEAAVLQNRELLATQQSLNELNEGLERKVLESTAALRNSETRFRALIEYASDIVAVVDTRGVITYVSPSIKRIAGYDADELPGRDFQEFAHPDDRSKTAAALEATLAAADVVHTVEFRFRHRDGRWLTLEAVARNAVADPVVQGIVVNARDVTERKCAEAATIASETKFRRLFEAARDGILLLDVRDGRIIDVNPFMIELLGYTREQYLGRTLWEIGPFKDVAASKAAFADLQANRNVRYADLPLRTADGRNVAVEFVSNVYRVNGGEVIQCNIRDVSERKRAMDVLRDAKDLLQAVVDNVPVRIFWKDRDLRYLGCNIQFAIDAGYSRPEELIGKTDFDMGWKGQAEAYRADDKAVMDSGNPKLNYEEQQTTPDGIGIWLRTSKVPLRDERNQVVGILGVYEDITARKTIEQTLRQRDAALREMGAVAKVGGWAFDAKTGQGTWTEEVARIHDVDPDAPTSLETVMAHYNGESRQKLEAAVRAAIEDARPYDLELELVTAKGEHKWVRSIARVVREAGAVVGITGSLQEVTDQVLARRELKRLNWMLQALSRSNSAMIHADDEEQMFRLCCEAIASPEGYTLAWIGVARDDSAQSVEIIAAAGDDVGYVQGYELSWADTSNGRGPAGIAIRTGAVHVIDDITESPGYRPWLGRATARGLRSLACVPIHLEGKVFGVLAVYSREPAAFGGEQVRLLEELASDMGYGMRTLRTQSAYESGILESAQQALRLRATMESAIEALAAMVEQRDPYTAGHQRRVAEFAVAIGRELGLDGEHLEGLRVAGTIHDIGKIYVPAEILSRPGKLTAPEFEIVKTHAQVGYDIVKGVDFPWPVALAILQHHERLDGSGYPQHLQGTEIILEARILAVADVIEAIASHRPYRAAVGIDAALDHVATESGRLYDTEVAAASIRLFREEGFQLSSVHGP